jgi:hypothetical protein
LEDALTTIRMYAESRRGSRGDEEKRRRYLDTIVGETTV